MTTANPDPKAGEKPPEGQPGQGTEPTGDKGKLSDKEAELLKENMSFKKKLKALEDAQAAADDARLKEQGKFKELAEKAEARAKAAQDAVKRARVEVFAARAGINDPDDIPQKLIDSLEVDDAGTVTGAAEAIEALKTAKPYLFGSTATTPGTKPTTTPKPTGSTTGSGGPATFDEWNAMPTVDKYAWAEKNPTAYEALCNAAKAVKRRF